MSRSKGTRYSEEQILRILREVEGGASVAEVCRKYEVSEATLYRWRSKYGGMDVTQLQRLRELETENARLKRIVAQQLLDNDALKDLLGKNGKPISATCGYGVSA
ncbi:MAG: transposase [Anaerolineae bacterium]|nr:transposase [Anaerolineae bacterium]